MSENCGNGAFTVRGARAVSDCPFVGRDAVLTLLNGVQQSRPTLRDFKCLARQFPYPLNSLSYSHAPSGCTLPVTHHKMNTSHRSEVLPQDTTHLIQRPCYQRGSPCKDPAGNRTTRRPPGGKETHLSVSALRPAFSWKLCAIEISCIIIIKVQQIQKRGKVTLRVQQTQKRNRIVKEGHWQGKLNKAILEVNGEGKAGQSDIVGFRKTKRLTKTYEFTVKESLTK